MAVLTITRHRRYTRNHTWHADIAGRALFLKASPNPAEARAEHVGHARICALYPVPRLHAALRIGPWTLTAYERWPSDGTGGLLLDEITSVDQHGSTTRLDACADAVFARYRTIIGQTLRLVPGHQTVIKLYGDRAAPGGRLDAYYQGDREWSLSGTVRVRPSELSALRLTVNGKEHAVDFSTVITWCRERLAPDRPVWAAVTQGDPTDLNIGWSPATGPVWFDYDTAGLNALPGEFACFLLYQRLHGAWLTPTYNPAAFRDHPDALAPSSISPPAVSTTLRASSLTIDYRHAPSAVRQHVIRRYLDEIVLPSAIRLGISDAADWLRPYLVMRLLAVYDLASLQPADTALCLALLAQALDPDTPLTAVLALTGQPSATASASSASRLAMMNSFSAPGFRSTPARSSPSRSTRSTSYSPREGSASSGPPRRASSILTRRATKKYCTATPESEGELCKNTRDAHDASAPSSSASSRCSAASTDPSVSSTPPPGAVQYGGCPGFVRLISTSRPWSSIKIARAARRPTATVNCSATDNSLRTGTSSVMAPGPVRNASATSLRMTLPWCRRVDARRLGPVEDRLAVQARLHVLADLVLVHAHRGEQLAGVCRGLEQAGEDDRLPDPQRVGLLLGVGPAHEPRLDGSAVAHAGEHGQRHQHGPPPPADAAEVQPVVQATTLPGRDPSGDTALALPP